eukprot:6492189-Amphidinium_carterae.5
MLVEGLCWLFAHKPFKLWPQHRWTGFDICVNQVGLLLACHNILQVAFVGFVKAMSSSKASAPQLGPGLAGFDGGAASCNHIGEPLASHDGACEVHPEAIGGYEAEGSLFQSTPTGLYSIDSPEAHAHDRKVALAWLDSKPLAAVMSLRLCLEPLVALMRLQFEVAGQSWELKQRYEVAKSLMGAQWAPATDAQRQYPISVAACHTHEKLYLEKVNLVLNAGVWECVPAPALTCKYRSQAFRSLSRQGCVVHELIHKQNQAFPSRLFRLLHYPDELQSMADCPSCVKGEFAASELPHLLACTPMDMLQRLQAFAAHWATNISTIEAKHASIRRGLHVKSTQTNAMQFAYASAEHVAQNIRRGEGSALSSRRCNVKKVAHRPQKVGKG